MAFAMGFLVENLLLMDIRLGHEVMRPPNVSLEESSTILLHFLLDTIFFLLSCISDSGVRLAIFVPAHTLKVESKWDQLW